MAKNKKRLWLRRTKRATASSYFDAVKRGDKEAMARFARQDSLEQRRVW
jgi:HEPN domain-containing protein